MSEPSLIPHILDAESLLAEFALFRAGHSSNYPAEFEAANRDTLSALVVFADTAILNLALNTGETTTTIRRRFRTSISGSLASWEGNTDG